MGNEKAQGQKKHFLLFFFAILVTTLYSNFSSSHERSLSCTKSSKRGTSNRKNEFLEIALKTGTDKVIADSGQFHSYANAYSKYFDPIRHEPIKLLEIGLGCDMGYGPGRSVQLWNLFFTNSRFDLWEAEFDADCAKKWEGSLKNPILIGDQADINVLKRWSEQSRGNFDFIIDDGGHTNNQILTSFTFLFHNALKPGGIYFIEDLRCSRHRKYQDSPKKAIDEIKSWIDLLVMQETKVDRKLRNIQSIECFKGMCAIHKCPVLEDVGQGSTCP
mmetsp:Transcript_2697/g.9652  ORF Transcript_2697/g.9652 Transcript_2697/m.9652 type:complete len:274 (+) Transcript_2697:1848-2669(+)